MCQRQSTTLYIRLKMSSTELVLTILKCAISGFSNRWWWFRCSSWPFGGDNTQLWDPLTTSAGLTDICDSFIWARSDYGLFVQLNRSIGLRSSALQCWTQIYYAIIVRWWCRPPEHCRPFWSTFVDSDRALFTRFCFWLVCGYIFASNMMDPTTIQSR